MTYSTTKFGGMCNFPLVPSLRQEQCELSPVELGVELPLECLWNRVRIRFYPLTIIVYSAINYLVVRYLRSSQDGELKMSSPDEEGIKRWIAGYLLGVASPAVPPTEGVTLRQSSMREEFCRVRYKK